MKDEDKTREELIHELVDLRQRVKDLKTCLEERKQTEEGLRKQKKELQVILDSVPAYIFYKDKVGRHIRINKALADRTGIPEEEWIGKTVFEVLPNLAERYHRDDMEVIAFGQAKRYIIEPLETPEGIRWAQTDKIPYRDLKGDVIGIIGLSVDITDRKRAEEELRETRDYLENLFNYANAPIIVWDPSFTITRFNHAFEHLTGRRATEVVGQPLDILFPKDKREEAMNHIRRAIAGERWEVVEIPILHTDGSVRIVLWNSATLYTEDGTKPIATIAQGQDITDRKQAEEALRETRDYLENLFNYANAPIIVWDPSFTITRFNHAFEHLTGRRATEVVGQPLDILFPKDKREEAMNHIRRAIAGERWEVVEIPILHTDGSVRIVLWNSATLYTEDGTTPIATIAQGQDITERKQVEERIKASLREKEILLRELHHRVKNNLQIISALLNLQSQQIKDKEAFEMFRESQNRIKSMALIHDQLYQFNDLAKINLAEYIQKLAPDLFYSYGVRRDGIELKINAQDVLLDVNTAIPCGLIINELVSNSLKHAFPDSMGGEICIDLRSNNDHTFTLIVNDSGIGFPRDLDFRNTETLGLQLVITLVEQLKGTIELDRSGGTTFKITFKELEI